jgi:hypothetical protein
MPLIRELAASTVGPGATYLIEVFKYFLNSSRQMKVKVSPCLITALRHENIQRNGVYIYHSVLQHLMEVNGQLHAQVALPLKEEPPVAIE